MLMLDLGNTRYKWIEAGAVATREPLGRRYAPEDAAAVLCREVMATTTARRWRGASVRDTAFDEALRRAFEAAGGEAMEFVTIPPQPPFRLAYDDPRQFGIDRYLDLLAARAEHPWPSIVVDAGTAVTVDALDAAGDHAGGVIFPGPALLRRSLARGTARIDIALDAAPALLGHSTASCVAGGVLQGFQGAVRGIVEAMAHRLGGRATIVVMGGDAALAASAVAAHDPVVDTRLLFKAMTLVRPCDI